MTYSSENRYFFTILFFLLLVSGRSSLCAQTLFELIYGTTAYDEVQSVVRASDSGYVVLGSSSSGNNGSTDVFLLKISPTGNWQWQHTLGGYGVEKGNALIATSDSGYAIAGFSNRNGSYDALLMKTDKNGNLLWSETFGGSDWDFANDLVEDSNGNLLICGSTFSSGAGNEDMYLMRTTSTGSLIWEKTFGTSAADAATALALTSDDGAVLTGYTYSTSDSASDLYIIRSDVSGNKIWEKTYGGSADEIGNDAMADNDGGFIIASGTKSFSPFDKEEIWILKIDAAGDTTPHWTRRYGASTQNRSAVSVNRSEDGGLIFSGRLDDGVSDDLFMLKTDPSGWYENIRTYGDIKQEIPCAAISTADSGFFLAGTTHSYGAGIPNIYLIKTGSDLVSTGSVLNLVSTDELSAAELQIHLYPNPANEHVIIATGESGILNMYNATGRLVLSKDIPAGSSRLELSHQSPGIYFLQYKGKENYRSGKLIIRR